MLMVLGSYPATVSAPSPAGDRGLAPQQHRQGPLRWHAPGSGPARLGAATTSRPKPPVRAGPPSGPTQQSD